MTLKEVKKIHSVFLDCSIERKAVIYNMGCVRSEASMGSRAPLGMVDLQSRKK